MTGTQVERASLAVRWADKVALGDGCWEWTGAKSTSGYGVIGYLGRAMRAHRVAYEIFVRPIPAGLCVCHHCDNPSCVRPDHLFQGTVADNQRDMVVKGRSNRGERHGHARLTEGHVREIRRRSAVGESQRSVARDLGVSQQHVSRIVRRHKWAHLE